MNHTPHQVESRWPHRWAVALVCATFPMIWIGGLVTTTGAGMAVPDWPNTYGYNLFAYPLETWIHGPWKLFIEHGHRLFGTLVGMITIGFLISTWVCQKKSTLRWLGAAALVGVLLQGVLGGMRVLAGQVLIAQVHGCVGPAFFAFTIALAAITSQRWRDAQPIDSPGFAKIERLGLIITFLAFLQIVLGSQLRHFPTGVRPGEFRLMLSFHLFVAAGLWVHIILLAIRARRTCLQESWIMRPVTGISIAIVVQIVLGLATWVTKYGFPAALNGFDFAAGFRPTADAPWQVAIATAHVAIGSMILGTSLLIALRAGRLVVRDETVAKSQQPSASISRGNGTTLLMEAAR